MQTKTQRIQDELPRSVGHWCEIKIDLLSCNCIPQLQLYFQTLKFLLISDVRQVFGEHKNFGKLNFQVGPLPAA